MLKHVGQEKEDFPVTFVDAPVSAPFCTNSSCSSRMFWDSVAERHICWECGTVGCSDKPLIIYPEEDGV